MLRSSVALSAVIFLILCAEALASEPFHVVVCTETVSAGEDNLRGAQELIKRYGDADSGGYIKHIVLPDQAVSASETSISNIVHTAYDPLTKLILVASGVPSTTEAFRQVHEIRPDILCFTAQAQEDAGVIESTSDIVCHSDSLTRGYYLVYMAKELGAKHFFHIGYPRNFSAELTLRRSKIIKKACEEFGITFHAITAPDPMSEIGSAGAELFVMQNIPTWIKTYGKDSVFFCTSDIMAEAVIKQVLAHGAIFLEPDSASPLTGYPAALNLHFNDEHGDFMAITKKIEREIVSRGAAGRMGAWAYSAGFSHVVSLAEYGMRCVERGITPGALRDNFSMEELCAIYEKNTPGATWKGNYYPDTITFLPRKNHLLLTQDTYIFGKGFMRNHSIEIPLAYRRM